VWNELGVALCLVLIIEGIIPFLYPARWRIAAESLSNLKDSQMRLGGFLSMMLGTTLLYLIR
jgi:hypothetical protein